MIRPFTSGDTAVLPDGGAAPAAAGRLTVLASTYWNLDVIIDRRSDQATKFQDI
jgi:hypothetical protein